MDKMPEGNVSWLEYLPAELQTLTDGDAVTIGRSGMQVFRVRDGYLKIALHSVRTEDTLLGEKERLRWLQGKLPVPQVYAYGKTAQVEYLYLSEIQGIMACDPYFQSNKPLLISLLADALHMVHAVTAQNCPFQQVLQQRLEEVEHRIATGQIDEVKFSGYFPELSLQEWYERVKQDRPPVDDLVFTHGDFCLPNILIDPEKKRISGLIDWGRAGVADRHEDLNSMCWSLGYNFNKSWIPLLRTAYGEELINPQLVAFYQLFDDLFHYLK